MEVLYGGMACALMKRYVSEAKSLILNEHHSTITKKIEHIFSALRSFKAQKICSTTF